MGEYRLPDKSPDRAQTCTEGLRDRAEEEIERRNPRWVVPIVVSLVGEESADATGRVFEPGDGVLKVAEDWTRAPELTRSRTPTNSALR
jgi:hypothetical protein